RSARQRGHDLPAAEPAAQGRSRADQLGGVARGPPAPLLLPLIGLAPGPDRLPSLLGRVQAFRGPHPDRKARMMMTALQHPLVTGYLIRLRHEAGRLPREQADELVSDIEAHLVDALDDQPGDAQVMQVLDRL